jgi:hypothetical protein
LEGGVEPPGATALLDPAAGPGEEPDPDPTDPAVVRAAVAPLPKVFIAAASATAFATASSATFVAAALSATTFSTAALSIDLSPLSYYLGIEVRHDEKGVWLGQPAYASKLLEKIGMGKCNPCAVPMDTKLKLSKESNSPTIDRTKYQSLIGSLRYLLHTRPELTFSVSYLSRFMECPRQEHMAAVKHLLQYVAGTLDYGLFDPRGSGGSPGVLGYSDSDMDDDMDDNKSTFGMIFFLGDNPTTWNS